MSDNPDISRYSRECPSCGQTPYGGTTVLLPTRTGNKVTCVICPSCGTVYQP